MSSDVGGTGGSRCVGEMSCSAFPDELRYGEVWIVETEMLKIERWCTRYSIIERRKVVDTRRAGRKSTRVPGYCGASARDNISGSSSENDVHESSLHCRRLMQSDQ